MPQPESSVGEKSDQHAAGSVTVNPPKYRVEVEFPAMEIEVVGPNGKPYRPCNRTHSLVG